MIPYMVGKLAPSSSYLTRGLVKCPRWELFSCRSLLKQGQICYVPAPRPQSLNWSIANEKGLPVFYLDISQAFEQVPVEEEMHMRPPPGCDQFSGEFVTLLKCQYGLEQVGDSRKNWSEAV